jgi:hypothetical protein
MSVAYPTKLDLARDLIEYVDDHSNDVVGDREHVDTGGRGEGDAWVRSVRASSVTCECLVRSGADHLDVLETRKLLVVSRSWTLEATSEGTSPSGW